MTESELASVAGDVCEVALAPCRECADNGGTSQLPRSDGEAFSRGWECVACGQPGGSW